MVHRFPPSESPHLINAVAPDRIIGCHTKAMGVIRQLLSIEPFRWALILARGVQPKAPRLM
jgi:hypothetical protein